jgi:hypothetical protein
LDHGVKITKAFDYLQDNGSSQCIVLINVGSYTPDSYSWKIFTIGLLPQTKPRLGIFYVDFTKLENKYDITEIPQVDVNKLRVAIKKLEEIINTFVL